MVKISVPKNPYIRLITLFILVLTIALGSWWYLFKTEMNADAAWYETSGWQYRKSLVIDSTNVSGTSTLTNFPVLVSRTDTDLINNTQSDGDDILFTSSDGKIKLDHEIESYNSSTGALVAWVEIPALRYDADTTIYMYYGNPNASSQQNITGTWESSYLMVQHLSETSGTTTNDSTANNNDGTKPVSATHPNPTTSGQINGAQNFDGTDDRITVGDLTTLEGASQATWSFWIRPTTLITNDSYFSKVNTVAGQASWLISAGSSSSTTLAVYIPTTLSDLLTVGWYNNALSNSTWAHVTAVFDGTLSGNSNRLRIYLNGSNVSLLFSGTIPATLLASSSEAVIAGVSGGSTANPSAIMDEVRVSTSARSADWIATEYANQNDPAGFFSRIGSQEEKAGPKLHFAFDEGYGSNAHNPGINGLVGSISGALWRTEDLCISGKCLYFDGSNDVVTTTGTTTDVKTVAFWVRPMTTTEQLVDLNGTASISVSSGTISATSFTSPTIYVDGKVSSTLVANRWQHITVTTGTGLSASALRLAQISTNYGQLFMDEFQIYSSELSANQVKSLYNSRGGNLTGVQFGAYDQKSLSDGLVGYWRFDETTGNATDSSGNATTLTNNSTTPYTGSKFGNSGEMDGSTDYFEATDNSPLSITGSVTLASWINNDDTTGSQNIIGKWDGTNNSYLLALEGDELRMYIDSSSDYQTTSAANISSNTFTHVAGIYDSSSRTVRLYVNGVEQPSSTTGTIPASIGDDAGEVIIGADDSPANYFDGHIDESRIYNRALSSSEIQQLYTWTPGPVGHWKLDDNTGTTAVDSSGNDLTMTGNGTYQWFTGKYGSGTRFLGGTNSYLSYTDTGSTLVDIPGSYTISSWVNLAVTNVDFQTFIFKSINNTDFDENYYLGTYYDAGGGNNYRDEFACEHAYAGNAFETVFTTSFNIQTNRWYHVSCVYNTITNTQQIYVDGILQATNASADNDPMIVYNSDSTGNLHLGGVNTAINFATATTNGIIDNIQIYNYPRTPSQVIQDMNAGHPIVGTPIAGPVGHWKFDEGYGTTANDSTPNDNDLTLSTASWSNDGKYGKALYGTGSTWASRTDTDFDFAAIEGFSISMWYRTTVTDVTGGIEYILSKSSPSLQGFALTIDNSDNISFSIDDDTSYTPDTTISDTVDTADGNWHHVVIVKDGTTSLKMYVDNRLAASSNSFASGSLSSAAALVVGDRTGANDGNEFSGYIDELKIYRAALTASDVLVEYNQGKSLVLGSLSTGSDGVSATNSAERSYCIPGDTSTCNAPVGEWRLDENTGTTAYDTSSSALDGSFGNSPRWAAGKFGGGVDMESTLDQYISFNSPLSSATALTFSTWFKMESGVSGYLFANSGGDAYIVEDGSGDVTFKANPGGVSTQCTTATNVISTGRWSHISFRYDGSTIKGYIDGIERCSVAASGTISSLNDEWRIGGRPLITSEADGVFDHAMIYDYARSPAQIVWDFNRGAPIAWWKFDELDGNTAYDASQNGNADSNNNVGTLTNTPTRTTSGKYNSAIDFDGTDDYIDIPDTSLLDITEDFTLSAWINREGGSSTQVISKTNSGTTGGYALLTGNSGEVYCRTSNGSGTIDSTASSGALSSGWNHIAAVRRGSSCSLYVNGINRTTTSGTHSSMTANALNLRIGSRPDSTELFNGIIDDARIYNFALTDVQLKTLMNENSAVRFGPQTGSP